jgi:hypothetical protein
MGCGDIGNGDENLAVLGHCVSACYKFIKFRVGVVRWNHEKNLRSRSLIVSKCSEGAYLCKEWKARRVLANNKCA